MTIREAMKQAETYLSNPDSESARKSVRESARKSARKSVRKSVSESARFDVLCLAEHAFGLDRTQLRLRAEQSVDTAAFFGLIERRRLGEPLQYILGEWEFYGLRFAVGPGVLIPRPETEMLVEIALDFLRGHGPCEVYDLCAGSGCVGLSVAQHCPQAQVKLLELSEDALYYLRQNAAHIPNAEVMQADVLHAPCTLQDVPLILSNPPYVCTEEIDTLSREVRQEPQMALDGGGDGLQFYRALAAQWLPRLAPGGLMACECGEGQAQKIAALFAPHGATKIRKDFNEIERVVCVRGGKGLTIAP